jgi:hypothetical protein
MSPQHRRYWITIMDFIQRRGVVGNYPVSLYYKNPTPWCWIQKISLADRLLKLTCIWYKPQHHRCWITLE